MHNLADVLASPVVALLETALTEPATDRLVTRKSSTLDQHDERMNFCQWFGAE